MWKAKSKKFWILFLIFAILIVPIGSVFIHKINNISQSQDNKKDNNEYITIEIYGEIRYPGKYIFAKGTLYKELFSKIGIISTSDLSNLKPNSKMMKDAKINIPKISNGEKILWSELNEISQLLKLGIKKNIAEKIINLRKRKEKVTWQDIENIFGIGPKTLEKLQKILKL